MKKKLLIFGAGETATIAAEFFIVDTKESLTGFIVDDAFWKPGMEHLNLPVYPFSKIQEALPSSKYKIFIAISYSKLNRDRQKAFNAFCDLGYELISYVSSKATLWRTAEIGKNCMIFEGNNLQHNSKISDNVILWAGNHIGHGSYIAQSSYVSSHVCIAGFANIGERCFLGVNSTVIDYAHVADDCFVGAAALINKNTEVNSIYTGNPAEKNTRISASKYFKIKE